MRRAAAVIEKHDFDHHDPEIESLMRLRAGEQGRIVSAGLRVVFADPSEVRLFELLLRNVEEYGETLYCTLVGVRPAETWADLAWITEHITDDLSCRAARYGLVIAGSFEWQVETHAKYPDRPSLLGTATLIATTV